NGIDGLVSGAIGAAIAGAQPVLAIVGDVSFLHDVGALAMLRSVATPLVVLVIDNDGGRIFEALPIPRQRPSAAPLPLVTTPHGIDLGAVARAFGVACVESRDASETQRAVAAAIASPRATIVRALVEPRDAITAFDALTASFARAFYGEAR